MTGSEEGAQRGAEMGASAFAERNFGLRQQDIQAIAHDIPPDRTLLLVLFEHRSRDRAPGDTGGGRRGTRRRH